MRSVCLRLFSLANDTFRAGNVFFFFNCVYSSVAVLCNERGRDLWRKMSAINQLDRKELRVTRDVRKTFGRGDVGYLRWLVGVIPRKSQLLVTTSER